MTTSILDAIDHVDTIFKREGTSLREGSPRFTPLGRDIKVTGVDVSKIPGTIEDLGELVAYTYDLSVTRAGELNIPVVGDISGGFDRRVVILEWTRYKELIDQEQIKYRYGYVIRFCLTVNQWKLQSQIRLPILAAKAELGEIKASWLMQIRGLKGKIIDEAILLPQELNVSTFVLAKQSLEKAIEAVHDPSTKFEPGILLATIDPTTPDTEYWLGAVKAYALSYIKRGKTQLEAIAKLGTPEPDVIDTIAETYIYLGVTDPASKPSDMAQKNAGKILRDFKVDV
jgi:hypothetical protein